MITWKKSFPDPWEGLPVDVLPCSNGEFFPGDPTPSQLAIMALAEQETEKARRMMNMSRRDFVRSAAAFSIGLWAINQITGTQWGGYQVSAHNTLTNQACDLEWPKAQLHNPPGEFVMDCQSHHVDPNGTWRATNPAIEAFFAAIWPQAGGIAPAPDPDPYWPNETPLRGGREVDPIENLGRYHYLKELFLDSSTNMTILSAVPAEPENQPLPVHEAILTLDTVRELSGGGAPRSYMHAFVMPNRGSSTTPGRSGVDPIFMNEEFEMMRQHKEQYGDKIRGWKIYTAWGDVPYSSGWYMDDHVGRKFCAQVQKIAEDYGGPAIIAVHKGFALPAFDQRCASPRDVGPAARAFPKVNFLIYHSGYDGEDQHAYPGDDKVNSADRGTDCLIKSLRENDYDATRFIKPGLEHGNVPNVYAESGSVWRSVMRNTRDASHYLGKMIKYVGPLRLIWGTDSLWFGSPQSEIVALRNFQFSEKGKEMYNLPYGLDGDAWDPRRNALSAASYTRKHRAVDNWPTDGRAHPERSIRNRMLGWNAVEVYQVKETNVREIKCDVVQRFRDQQYLTGQGATLRSPLASNSVYGPRNNRETWADLWKEPWHP